jgi:hypothetical protein
MSKGEVNRGLSVLVVSCDRYSDLWGPFFKLFKRFWPDCPFKVYLLSNTLKPDLAGVRNLSTGEDISWSDNLLKALKDVPEEYVLLFIDDLFLYRQVDTKEVLRLFEWILYHGPNCVRMNCYADNLPVANLPDKRFSSLVGIVSPGCNYRVSTVLTVWKKEFLTSLLKAGESAWEFEANGSARSVHSDGFYSTWKNYFPVVNSVIRGKWRMEAIRKIESLGIEFDKGRRPFMSKKEAFTLYLKERRSFLLALLPTRYRLKVKEFFIGMGL